MTLALTDIAVAQLNLTVGDVEGNAKRLADAYAAASGAKLVLAPELAICGYPPEDLVLRPAFRTACREAMEGLAAKVGEAAFVVGGIHEEEGRIYNAAFVLWRGAIHHVQRKLRLPNYGVFDEKRLFAPGGLPLPVEIHGAKLGILICEDLWTPEAARHLQQNGAELLAVINASPYDDHKHVRRMEVALRTAKETGLPLVYANLVGGQDDLVFDGASFACDGKVTVQFPAFEERVAQMKPGDLAQPLSHPASVYEALKLGLRDYVGKNGFAGVLLGLSGGIDSALVAAIAADALGGDKVKGVLLPSPYTSQDSIDDALETAKLLGIQTSTVPITPAMETFQGMLEPSLGDGWMEEPAVGGNLQARIRGNVLMAISNRTGAMLLNTGNKSEFAVGYTTLYGDMCGGYAVLKDVYKTEVYALSKWRNGQGAAIPERSIAKAPTAELKPGQLDQDQLPPYGVLDTILDRLIEKRQSVAEITAAGFAPDVVGKVERLLRLAEYKRRQSPPGAKVTSMLFGKDRRFPITNGFKA